MAVAVAEAVTHTVLQAASLSKQPWMQGPHQKGVGRALIHRDSYNRSRSSLLLLGCDVELEVYDVPILHHV